MTWSFGGSDFVFIELVEADLGRPSDVFGRSAAEVSGSAKRAESQDMLPFFQRPTISPWLFFLSRFDLRLEETEAEGVGGK